MDVNIYALTDSHQESRNLSTLLSYIAQKESNSNQPFVVLDAGDLFKGIYDRELSVNAYLKLKELCRHAQIFLTLGNNDFGFGQDDFDFLKKTIKRFENARITFVCANLKNLSTGEYSKLVPRYKILNINNRKILITGFCLNTSIIKRFGYEFEPAPESLKNLVQTINEDYDDIIVLNHHWYSYSKELKEFAANNGISIKLIIGGHEHSLIVPDYDNNIFYPLAFARTLYTMQLSDKITNIVQISVSELKITQEFEIPIREYENKTELFKPIAKRVLNLYKWYSEPCALGTFISDNMKRIANTEIAFHSTGFTMYPLKTDSGDVITKYDFERVICASTPVVKVKINAVQLKEVFENATMKRMYKNNGNSRFLQCSQNITITGHGNPEDNTYKILQIEIDGQKLLDSDTIPIDSERTYTCAIDSFIASGEQGYTVLKNLPQMPVIQNGKEVHLNTLLLESLKLAQYKYPPKTEYPAFILCDI